MWTKLLILTGLLFVPTTQKGVIHGDLNSPAAGVASWGRDVNIPSIPLLPSLLEYNDI